MWNSSDLQSLAKGVTGYLEIPRGRIQFKLRAAGGGEDLATIGNRELIPGRHYTLVALPREKGGPGWRF